MTVKLRGLAVVGTMLVLAPASARAAKLPPEFVENRYASGFAAPTAMAFSPDGRLFVCEQRGQLRVVKDGALLPTPFVSLSVDASGERGLLGVAFDPDFVSNGFVYLYYTATTPHLHNRVSRFTASGDTAVPGSETILLELDPLSGARNHNGGALHFGADGKLYVAVGDNARGSNSQSLQNLLGKILRINKDGSIPADNPFAADALGVNRAIWALGLRNPFTFAFQPGTGRMHINDVGQQTWEEINAGAPGANYGWPATEGPTNDPRFTGPIHAYGHGTGPRTGCAITGGTFYNPATRQFPTDYVGKYFYSDFCTGWIRTLDVVTHQTAGFATGAGSPVDLRVTDDGSLFYLDRSARAVYQVRFTGGVVPHITTHPESVTVSQGSPVSLSVAATGQAPLAYQWELDGVDVPGAIEPTYEIPAVSLALDGAEFGVRVSNAHGSVTSETATLTVLPNTAPTARIVTPKPGMRYRGGQKFRFRGVGKDLEDGALPASAFTWRIDFHHDTHHHPFMFSTPGIKTGTFTIPTLGETSTNVFYRIVLTVTDRSGATDTSFVDLAPRTSRIELVTQPPGLVVTLDGQPSASPLTFESVVGITRSIGVVPTQSSGAVTYDFVKWADRRAETRDIRTPSRNKRYVARFRARPAVGQGLVGTYFDREDLSGKPVKRVDPLVDFDWGMGSPDAAIESDTFSARWTGRVKPRVSGRHRFYVSSDDGARLWVNGRLIVDTWSVPSTPGETSGTIALKKNAKYDVRLEYFELTGSAHVSLSWEAKGLPKEIVPSEHLYPYALLVVPKDVSAVRKGWSRHGSKRRATYLRWSGPSPPTTRTPQATLS